ncbi:MAG: hypothetical protein IIC26_06970, partial [Chloroflexi bacterium]|nr:hypothetical protein [Chloroflexota bacterium]
MIARFGVLLSILALLAGVAILALAGVIRPVSTTTATTGNDAWTTGGNGTTLARIDLKTGIAATVGFSGFSQTWAAAFTPDGTLWTITNGFTISLSNLATFNLSTGAATNVGSPMGTSNVIALEADAAGNLYAGGFNGSFYSVNKSTGQLTFIGNMGFPSVMDFAFDSSGTLWAVDGCNRLYTVNPATG